MKTQQPQTRMRDALKGHGFSRPTQSDDMSRALAPEGRLRSRNALISFASSISFAAITVLLNCHSLSAQTAPMEDQAQHQSQATVLDSVIAVVNHTVILSSDLDLELRMMRLIPTNIPARPAPVEASEALDQLTTRALIEQQILLEDPHGLEIDPAQLNQSLIDLRQSLPACNKHNCASPKGWSDYLATLGLTPGQVERYWGRRLAVLAFIERRFRSGIRIAPEEVEKYYRQNVLRQYPSPASAPPLDKLSSRIQQLLLEQQVDALLDDWLKNLQAQGEVEILDPALAASAEKAREEKNDEAAPEKANPEKPSQKGEQP